MTMKIGMIIIPKEVIKCRIRFSSADCWLSTKFIRKTIVNKIKNSTPAIDIMHGSSAKK